MSTTTLFNPYPIRCPTQAVHYLCQSWWTCHSSGRHTWRNRSDSLLATGHPLSVLPPTIREELDVVVTPVRGWKGKIPLWFGIPCRVGRVTTWLPILEPPGLQREFSLLVLLPQDDLEDAPPFIHLGTQFLLEYRGQLSCDCSSPTNLGLLVIP